VSTCSPPNGNIKISPYCSPPNVRSESHYNAALPDVPKALPSLKHTSTRRTSGRCLGTFKTGKKVSCPPPPPRLNVGSLATSTTFSLLSLFILGDEKEGTSNYDFLKLHVLILMKYKMHYVNIRWFQMYCVRVYLA
jgi:hypothetical protein